MTHSRTTPATSEPESGADFVPGTIGFDLYLAALQVPRAALTPPLTPKEAVK
jgi:hypothetical protein